MFFIILISVAVVALILVAVYKNQAAEIDKVQSELKMPVEEKEYDVKLNIEQRQLINSVALILESESKSRKSTLKDYRVDKEAQNIVRIYSSPLISIGLPQIPEIIGTSFDNIDEGLMDEFIEKMAEKDRFMKDEKLIKSKTESLLILFSNIINCDYSFVEIRRLLDKWVYELQVETSTKNPVSLLNRENGNSTIPPAINSLTDAIKIIDSEKFYNKGTEYFKNGNYILAIEQFEKAAELDDKDALYQLGNAFLNGSGVTQNFDKAFDYYLRSANLNHEKAQYNLGLFYIQAPNIERNIPEAKKWLKKAADNGYLEAEKTLKSLDNY